MIVPYNLIASHSATDFDCWVIYMTGRTMQLKRRESRVKQELDLLLPCPPPILHERSKMRVVPALVYLLAGFLADGHPTASAEPNLYQLCDHRVFPEIKPDAASAIPKMEEADSQHHEVLEQHFHTKVLIKDREVHINNPFPGECFSTVHLFSDPLTPLIRSHVHRGWNVLHGQDLEPNYLVARLEHPVESATQITVTYSTGQNVYEDLVQGLQSFEPIPEEALHPHGQLTPGSPENHYNDFVSHHATSRHGDAASHHSGTHDGDVAPDHATPRDGDTASHHSGTLDGAAAPHHTNFYDGDASSHHSNAELSDSDAEESESKPNGADPHYDDARDPALQEQFTYDYDTDSDLDDAYSDDDHFEDHHEHPQSTHRKDDVGAQGPHGDHELRHTEPGLSLAEHEISKSLRGGAGSQHSDTPRRKLEFPTELKEGGSSR
ncbi:hypothetical protein KEM48_012688 [Puccinia striiformis f. sp. tritici PST-130]|nr:hypothetical protein KEM48_012688 [Puccinia striiformis f. sp. tritici PST-130]